MPNHIRNVIAAAPEVLDKIRAALRGDDRTVDFNRLVPMPDDILRGNLQLEDMRRSQGRNWYDWSVANWGTKWNAYAVKDLGSSLQFETAWSFPELIARALAVAVPEDWSWQYASEDWGSNLGTVRCVGGECVEDPRPEDGEAFARRLWGFTDEDED